MLRNSHDRRTAVYALLLFPLVPVLGITLPRLSLLLAAISLYLSYAVGVIVHNHTHTPIFMSRSLNRLFSVWLSGFYGFPVFSWIPTHLGNHHKHVDGPLDVASTHNAGKDSLLAFLTYPMYAGRYQARLVFSYLKTRIRRRGRGWLVLECLFVPAMQIFWFFLASRLHDGSQALVRFAIFGFAPAFLASPLMMATNYLQHIGCSPDSLDEHSRNFVSRWSNYLLFNAGYHTVHHEYPSVHWSSYPELHQARTALIPERLLERDPVSFVLGRYWNGTGAADGEISSGPRNLR